MLDTVDLSKIDLSKPAKLRNNYHSTIKAINPKTGEIESYDGPVVLAADSFDDAQNWLNTHGFPFAVADGVILGSNYTNYIDFIPQYKP